MDNKLFLKLFFKGNKISEREIRKIVKEDGDTTKHFKDEIIGYKAYSIPDYIGSKYFNNDTKNFILRIRYEDLMVHPERYFIITKLRAKMPVVSPEEDRLIDNDYNYLHKYMKYRAMCIVNDDIIDFSGKPVEKFPKYFRRDLVMAGPMITATKEDYREVRMHRYVFPDYLALNYNTCDHGISFFSDYKEAFRFIMKHFYHDYYFAVLDVSQHFIE